MKKMSNREYPRRLWGIFGFPESGKSTFLTQMRGPLFVVDADFRFDEKQHLWRDEVYWNAAAAENNDPLRIVRALTRDLGPGDVKIGTICVDSLTAIIQPFITEALLSNRAGENTNKAAAFTAKAVAIRSLQDGITRYGTDVAWIWHLQGGRDHKAEKVVTPTIPKEELKRLKRSINMLIHLGKDEKGRYASVEWTHEKGNTNVKLYDESGRWVGMPERLELAVYGFNGIQHALTWSINQGVYPSPQKAQECYEQVRENTQPKSAQAMWNAWQMHVESILKGDGNGHNRSPQP